MNIIFSLSKKENFQKTSESIRKLNDGLNLVEQQNDETRRQLEKVMSAEIKLRKQRDKDFEDRLQSYNDKFMYSISSFQATIGSLGQRLNEQKDTVSDYLRLDVFFYCLYWISSLSKISGIGSYILTHFR